MARTIHELAGVATMRIAGFVTKAKQASEATRKFRESWTTAGRDIGRAATRIGVVVGGALVCVGKVVADFEQTMTRAGAVTRTLGTTDFVKLEDAARRMGETTVFSAREAAEAIEQMGLAGLSTNEIIEALPGALQLASAAQVSIAEASDVAAKTMRAFGADASELDHINDDLVGRFTKTKTTLAE